MSWPTIPRRSIVFFPIELIPMPAYGCYFHPEEMFAVVYKLFLFFFCLFCVIVCTIENSLKYCFGSLVKLCQWQFAADVSLFIFFSFLFLFRFLYCIQQRSFAGSRPWLSFGFYLRIFDFGSHSDCVGRALVWKFRTLNAERDIESWLWSDLWCWGIEFPRSNLDSWHRAILIGSRAAATAALLLFKQGARMCSPSGGLLQILLELMGK